MIALLALLACGTPTLPPDGSPGGPPFPHPASYADDHGTDAVTHAGACADCHAVDSSSEAPPGSGPACSTCHAYPHPEGFRAGATHGPAWKADAATACVACHGADGKRPPAAVAEAACVGCHSSFPHPAGWANAETSLAQHGQAALLRGGAQACAGCHDGAPGQPTCDSCHAAWPHPSDWASAHGDAWRAAPEACGTACHSAGRAPPSPPACAECHTRFPHPADWTRAHIRVVETNTEAGCATCHAAGTLAGPVLLNPTCGPTCHGATP